MNKDRIKLISRYVLYVFNAGMPGFLIEYQNVISPHIIIS